MVVPDNMHTVDLVVYTKISENLKILSGHLFVPYLLVKKILEKFQKFFVRGVLKTLSNISYVAFVQS